MLIFFSQVKHDDGLYISRTQKVISEIFLTRLLTTKVCTLESHSMAARTLPTYYQYPFANVTRGPECIYFQLLIFVSWGKFKDFAIRLHHYLINVIFLFQGTVQQYIDDLFLQILKVDHTLPPAIKYLYDFLDTAARRHNIVDAEVVHTWKSNRFVLKLWFNLFAETKSQRFIQQIIY